MEKKSIKSQIEKVLKTIILKKYPFIENIKIYEEVIGDDVYYYSISLFISTKDYIDFDEDIAKKVQNEIRDLCDILFQSYYDELIYRKIYSIGWETN